MIFWIFSPSSVSCCSSSARRADASVTCFLICSASSFRPFAIRPPICLEILLRFARRASASCLTLRFSASSSITSSTSANLRSWNLLRMFCLTISGFSLTNFKSNIFVSSSGNMALSGQFYAPPSGKIFMVLAFAVGASLRLPTHDGFHETL